MNPVSRSACGACVRRKSLWVKDLPPPPPEGARKMAFSHGIVPFLCFGLNHQVVPLYYTVGFFQEGIGGGSDSGFEQCWIECFGVAS